MESAAPANIMQITPFMHVRTADFDAAVSFFTRVLGFQAITNAGGYAYVERDGCGVRIMQHDDDAEVGTPHHGFAYYADVRDVQALARELAAGLATLPEGSVLGPIDRPYAQRELMVRAPDGNLVVFGQAIDGVSELR